MGSHEVHLIHPLKRWSLCGYTKMLGNISPDSLQPHYMVHYHMKASTAPYNWIRIEYETKLLIEDCYVKNGANATKTSC